MAPLAVSDCALKVDIHCDKCKKKMMDVLRSIRGIAKISGEVDPNVLITALGRLGKHAELINVSIRHPKLQRRNYDDDDHSYNHGSHRSLCDAAYYEVDQPRRRRQLPVIEYPYSYSENYLPSSGLLRSTNEVDEPRRQPVVQYPYSYSDDYDSCCSLPPATHVPSYPAQCVSNYHHKPSSFCCIM